MAEEIMAGTVAESAVGAESTTGNETNAQNTEGTGERDEFLSGLFGEDEGFSFGEPESSGNDSTTPPVSGAGTPLKEGGKTGEETGAPNAESEQKPVTTFVEHGKTYEVPTEALNALAESVGLSPEAVIERFQKGSGFDAQQQRLIAAEADAKALAELAAISGKNKNDLLADVRAMNGKFALDRKIEELNKTYPGAAPEMIKALAEAQLKGENADRVNAESIAAAEAENAKIGAKIEDLRGFLEKHPEFNNKNVDPSVLAEFEQGVPIEAAFGHWQQRQEQADKIAELERQVAAEKENVKMAEQKAFNNNNTPGSASGLGSNARGDLFLEGLLGR